MTTKLEEVLAETWQANEVRPSWDEVYGPVVNLTDHLNLVGTGRHEDETADRTLVRAAVCVLGKSALALVLKHEWCDDECQCPECGAFHFKDNDSHPENEPHKPDCAWGRIVKAAREIG